MSWPSFSPGRSAGYRRRSMRPRPTLPRRRRHPRSPGTRTPTPPRPPGRGCTWTRPCSTSATSSRARRSPTSSGSPTAARAPYGSSPWKRRAAVPRRCWRTTRLRRAPPAAFGRVSTPAVFSAPKASASTCAATIRRTRSRRWFCRARSRPKSRSSHSNSTWAGCAAAAAPRARSACCTTRTRRSRSPASITTTRVCGSRPKRWKRPANAAGACTSTWPIPRRSANSGIR